MRGMRQRVSAAPVSSASASLLRRVGHACNHCHAAPERSLEVSEVPAPEPGSGELLVEGVALGVCGTDREIAVRVRLGSAGGTPPDFWGTSHSDG